MCAIVGALLPNVTSMGRAAQAEENWKTLVANSHARGRDGFGWKGVYGMPDKVFTRGYKALARDGKLDLETPPLALPGQSITNMSLICNFRAEPTTEHVRDKLASDQQPYTQAGWNVVHNGTIANDKALRTYRIPTSIDSAAIAECLLVESRGRQLFEGGDTLYATFRTVIEKLIGSYAILTSHDNYPNQMFVACNYRPIWYAQSSDGVYFASAKEYFPRGPVPQMLEPYSTAHFQYADGQLEIQVDSLQAAPKVKAKVLVVASGGLDSTVAAAQCLKDGYDVTLLHFEYGCRAEAHELAAVQAIAEELGTPWSSVQIPIYNKTDSPLMNDSSTISDGESGAEFAHEWIPARNLVLLSVATAYAEGNGFDYIALGNNLEEAGAYPDNEPEFIRKFNELLPFAVGSNARVRVLMPVGDLMKHEIVALGHWNGAPMHLTWSCYRNGALHCGKCGPCFMRKTAFEINSVNEVINYEE